jgi:PKD repeat protein
MGSANVGSNASYVWDFGDGSAPSTVANPQHQFPWANPSAPVAYTVTLIIENACGTDQKQMTVTPNILGVNEINDAVSYKVYPNPSNGVVNIEFNGTVADQASLRVLDITGRVVSTSNANTNDIHTMDMSGVASGTYILEVSVDGATSQSRISIQ